MEFLGDAGTRWLSSGPGTQACFLSSVHLAPFAPKPTSSSGVVWVRGVVAAWSLELRLARLQRSE